MSDKAASAADILRKRSVLFSFRMRFSPETQPVRQAAIDKMVEQSLVLADYEVGWSVKDIQEQVGVWFRGARAAITRLDIEDSLRRLTGVGRALAIPRGQETGYKLSDQALREVGEVQRSSDARFEGVVCRLFQNAPQGPTVYRAPFLDCLCAIFSELAEAYVRVLREEIGPGEFVEMPAVTEAVEEVTPRYGGIDAGLLGAGVLRFFRDSDPDYDLIKWNMTQNYYVATALGLDPGGRLLSRELFDGAVFYLDTNVVIHALEPKAQHHRSFKVLGQACKQLRISLNVCQISLDELTAVVRDSRYALLRVADEIPEETAPKVGGIFYHLYREEQAKGGAVDFDQLFSEFAQARAALAESYGVELVDDVWFSKAQDDPETAAMGRRVREEYEARREGRRGRAKAVRPAIHDALLLRWLQLEREQHGRNVWLVTLDRSLPGVRAVGPQGAGRPLAITLDALLQWISPIVAGGDGESDLAAIFAEAVRYHLLPQDRVFDLRDFLLFAEMEWSCKQLPAEDVEECIRYVKRVAADLDPSVPEDRERLAHEMSRFFADPGRKYKRALQDLETRLAQKDQAIKDLQTKHQQELERIAQQALRVSAWRRLGVGFGALFVGEGVGAYLAARLGAGANAWQRIVSSLPMLGLGVVVWLFLMWVVLGRERLGVLGWAFRKILKAEWPA